MTTQVIVLNGGSSSGKSGIARCLQAILPDPWLSLGVDTLIEAMPVSAQTSASGIQFPPGGAVVIGPEFRGAGGSVDGGSRSDGTGRRPDYRR